MVSVTELARQEGKPAVGQDHGRVPEHVVHDLHFEVSQTGRLLQDLPISLSAGFEEQDVRAQVLFSQIRVFLVESIGAGRSYGARGPEEVVVHAAEDEGVGVERENTGPLCEGERVEFGKAVALGGVTLSG